MDQPAARFGSIQWWRCETVSLRRRPKALGFASAIADAFDTQQTVTFAGQLGQPAASVSASRDGPTIFFSHVDASADELMLVDGFH